MVGSCSYQLTYLGRADHAGTIDRLAAAQGASAFTLAVRQVMLKEFPNCVANVGAMAFVPGAFNIVPAKVTLSLELRTPSAELLERLESRLLIDLFSGAWHDAQSLVGICPVGMLFVPSQGGASHSVREFTTWEDCLTGANVLLQAALELTVGYP